MRYKLIPEVPTNPVYPDEAFITGIQEIRSCRSSIYISPSQISVHSEVDVYSWIKEQKLKLHDPLREEEVADALQDEIVDESIVELYKQKCYESSTAPVNQIIEALKGERDILNLNVS